MKAKLYSSLTIWVILNCFVLASCLFDAILFCFSSCNLTIIVYGFNRTFETLLSARRSKQQKQGGYNYIFHSANI